jgi:hypothetical protein
LLILLDEFDVVQDKAGLGSLIKSLSSDEIKFAICGIGSDLGDLVADHGSVERLLEEGSLHVAPMPTYESEEIIHTAEKLFEGAVAFEPAAAKKIAELSKGYPYFTQLLGKECVVQAADVASRVVTEEVLNRVVDDVKSGRAFPTLEQAYQRAIGDSTGRQILLHLLADQPDEIALYNDDVGKVVLKKARKDAEDLDVPYVDQLIPRLVDAKYGPVLRRSGDRQGLYEFVNPVLRLYVNLRKF